MTVFRSAQNAKQYLKSTIEPQGDLEIDEPVEIESMEQGGGEAGRAANGPEADTLIDVEAVHVEAEGRGPSHVDGSAGLGGQAAVAERGPEAADGRLLARPQVDGVAAGSMVAVLCRVDEESIEEEWTLATILSYSRAEGHYEVQDCETDNEGLALAVAGPGNRRFIPEDRLLHLASSDDEALIGEEQRLKAPVLALFPGTTCLYPAVVISTPSRRRKTRDYLLRFNDDEAPSRACPARFVLPLPAAL